MLPFSFHLNYQTMSLTLAIPLLGDWGLYSYGSNERRYVPKEEGFNPQF